MLVASLTADRLATTRPSTGMRSPGRIRTRSSGLRVAAGTSSSVPSGRMPAAVSGASSNRRAIVLFPPLRANSPIRGCYFQDSGDSDPGLVAIMAPGPPLEGITISSLVPSDRAS